MEKSAILRNAQKSMDKIEAGEAIPKAQSNTQDGKPKRRGIVSFIGNLLPQVAYMQVGVRLVGLSRQRRYVT